MTIICYMLLLTSCAGPEVKITKDTTYNPPVPMLETEYYLGPGDVIEIVYHVVPKPDKHEYILAVGDVVKVEFTYHKDVNRKLTVAPDGNITLPRKGRIQAAGLTVSQLQTKLVRIYSDIFRDPEITITMVKYNTAIYSLRKAITTAPRGQSKLTTIRPDGYVSFPMIDDIYARGLTLPQLKEIVSGEYAKIINNLKVTLILKILKNNVVYVMGEVNKPNVYLMERPVTVMQILSLAGGVTDAAKKKSILVIRLDEKRNPQARLVNLEQIISFGNIADDLLLRQYDIVYVPKTEIARADLWVNQHLSQIIPSWFKLGVTFSHRF